MNNLVDFNSIIKNLELPHNNYKIVIHSNPDSEMKFNQLKDIKWNFPNDIQERIRHDDNYCDIFDNNNFPPSDLIYDKRIEPYVFKGFKSNEFCASLNLRNVFIPDKWKGDGLEMLNKPLNKDYFIDINDFLD